MTDVATSSKYLILAACVLMLGACTSDPQITQAAGNSDTSAAGNEVLPADYIGLTVSEARALAEENDVPFRVVELDGTPQPVTKDYRPGRINASVSDGRVTDYKIEGDMTAEPTRISTIVTYTCDGGNVFETRDNFSGSVEGDLLIFDDQTKASAEVSRGISASGAKYESADGALTFWSQGDEAQLLRGDTPVYTNCVKTGEREQE